jgi:hypothetical protein
MFEILPYMLIPLTWQVGKGQALEVFMTGGTAKRNFQGGGEYCWAYVGLQTPLFLTLQICGRKEYCYFILITS